MVAHLKIGNILSQALSSAGLSPPSTLYKQWKAEEQGKRKSKSCASVFKALFVFKALSNLITSGSTAYSYGRTVRKANQFGTTGETSSQTAPAADALVDSQLLGHVQTKAGTFLFAKFSPNEVGLIAMPIDHHRFNCVFITCTYTLPLLIMGVCYSRMARWDKDPNITHGYQTNILTLSRHYINIIKILHNWFVMLYFL